MPQLDIIKDYEVILLRLKRQALEKLEILKSGLLIQFLLGYLEHIVHVISKFYKNTWKKNRQLITCYCTSITSV